MKKMNLTDLTTLLFFAIPHGSWFAQASPAAPGVEQRMRQALEGMADRPSPFEGAAWALRHAYARQLAGREKDAALINKAVLDYCASCTLDKDAALHPYSDPRPEGTLFSIYLGAATSGLLTPESRDAIEDACWRWVYRHSNLKSPPDGKGRPWPLNNPKENVWIITGSENHDAVQRAANLFSLQILMKAGTPYGPDAKLHDGFTVAEHYREWLRWYPEFATKDYTLSTLSFDPAREYIALVNQSRMMGVTFSHDPDDRIVVYAGNTPVDSKREYKMPTNSGTNGMLRPDCMTLPLDAPRIKQGGDQTSRL